MLEISSYARGFWDEVSLGQTSADTKAAEWKIANHDQTEIQKQRKHPIETTNEKQQTKQQQ